MPAAQFNKNSLKNKLKARKKKIKMHILQSKHSKLKPEEAKKLLLDLNVSLNQLPKIKAEDAGMPENCKVGDIIKIERKQGDKIFVYYRVVV